MKTVFLLRHGKSDWNAGYDGDHNRPLADRGRKAAEKIGKYLAKIDSIPDAIVSSTATRALDTVTIASKKGKWGVPIEKSRSLYGASASHLIEVIQDRSDSDESLMLVGHEPGWSETVGMLIGQANVRFPTAALACIEFDVSSWSSVRFGSGALVWFVTPKSLPG